MIFTTSVEYIRMGIRYAQECGFDYDWLIKESDFDASILNEPGARISFFEFSRLWGVLEKNTKDPDFGLHMGEKMFEFPGHILFLLILNAPTLKNAIDILCRYFNLLTDIHSPKLLIVNQSAQIILRYHVKGLLLLRHSNEGILAGLASVIQRISGGQIKFDSVQFTHSKPESVAEHQRIFNAPILFNKEENRLAFKSKYLAHPIFLSNQVVFEKLKKLASEFQNRLYVDSPWSEKVKETLFNFISNGESEIDFVARKLAVTPRNLQKKLREEQVTFNEILNFVKKEKCLELLKRKNISISDISLLLGYSDQSSFSRAFKRWYGISPKQYRLQLKSSEHMFSQETDTSFFENHFNYQIRFEKNGCFNVKQHLFKKRAG